MKSSSSLSRGSGGQTLDSLDMAWVDETIPLTNTTSQRPMTPQLTSSSQTSLPACMLTSAPVLFITKTLLTPPTSLTASSTVAFSGMVFPPRTPSSAVTTTSAAAKGGGTRQEGGVCVICNDTLTMSAYHRQFSPSRTQH